MKNLKSKSLKKLNVVVVMLIATLTTFSVNALSPTKMSQNLNMAVINNDIELVKKMIAEGVDINQKDAMSGATALITAASFNKPEIAKLLIDAGADLELRAKDGATALHAATFFCNVEITKMLIDANANKTVKNNFGATPYESVSAPYDQLEPIYKMIQQQLQPLGLEIDLSHIKKTRPEIAKMLK